MPILWQMVQFEALCAFFDDAVWREFGSLQLVVLASAGAVFSGFLITSLYLYIFVAIIIRWLLFLTRVLFTEKRNWRLWHFKSVLLMRRVTSWLTRGIKVVQLTLCSFAEFVASFPRLAFPRWHQPRHISSGWTRSIIIGLQTVFKPRCSHLCANCVCAAPGWPWLNIFGGYAKVLTELKGSVLQL